MASGEKVIKLSHNELTDLASNHEENSQILDKDSPKDASKEKANLKSKRPDKAIYKPSRQRRDTGDSHESAQSGTLQQRSPDEPNINNQPMLQDQTATSGPPSYIGDDSELKGNELNTTEESSNYEKARQRRNTGDSHESAQSGTQQQRSPEEPNINNQPMLQDQSATSGPPRADNSYIGDDSELKGNELNITEESSNYEKARQRRNTGDSHESAQSGTQQQRSPEKPNINNQPMLQDQSATSGPPRADNSYIGDDSELKGNELNITEESSNYEKDDDKGSNQGQASNSQRKARPKRPDKQIYVPKARQQQTPSTGPGLKYGGIHRGITDDVIVHHQNSRSSSASGGVDRKVNIAGRNDDALLITVSNSEQHGPPRKSFSGGRRRQRQTSCGSHGSIEFLDDDLEWDYQVDIDVKRKGEHGDGEIDFGDEENSEDDDSNDYLLSHESHDLEHDGDYKGLPLHQPIQKLLGPDINQTLKELEISFSAEEGSDDDGDQHPRKKRVTKKKRTPRSQERNATTSQERKDDLNNRKPPSRKNTPTSSHDSESPRDLPLDSNNKDSRSKTGKKTGSASPLTVCIANKIPKDGGSDYNSNRVVVSDTDNVGKVEAQAQSPATISNKAMKGKVQGESDKKVISSPREQRKERVRDRGGGGGSRQIETKNRSDKFGREDRNKQGRGFGRNDPRFKDRDGRTSAQDDKKQNKDSTPLPDKSSAPITKSNNRSSDSSNKIKETASDRRGRHSSNLKSSNHRHGKNETDTRNVSISPSKMHWGDQVEMGDEEIDYEHTLVDIWSESSSQSGSKLSINSTPTPTDTEKAGPGFDEHMKKSSGRNGSSGVGAASEGSSKSRNNEFNDDYGKGGNSRSNRGRGVRGRSSNNNNQSSSQRGDRKYEHSPSKQKVTSGAKSRYQERRSNSRDMVESDTTIVKVQEKTREGSRSPVKPQEPDIANYLPASPTKTDEEQSIYPLDVKDELYLPVSPPRLDGSTGDSPIKVTEYDMEDGGSFVGLVITNSSYNNKGGSSSSDRRRSTSESSDVDKYTHNKRNRHSSGGSSNRGGGGASGKRRSSYDRNRSEDIKYGDRNKGGKSYHEDNKYGDNTRGGKNYHEDKKYGDNTRGGKNYHEDKKYGDNTRGGKNYHEDKKYGDNTRGGKNYHEDKKYGDNTRGGKNYHEDKKYGDSNRENENYHRDKKYGDNSRGGKNYQGDNKYGENSRGGENYSEEEKYGDNTRGGKKQQESNRRLYNERQDSRDNYDNHRYPSYPRDVPDQMDKRQRERGHERTRTTSHSSTESAPTAKGGGILHLPASSSKAVTSTSISEGKTSTGGGGYGSKETPNIDSRQSFPTLQGSSKQTSHSEHQHYHQQQSRGGERGRGATRGRGSRGGTHRTLYDPNNPQATSSAAAATTQHEPYQQRSSAASGFLSSPSNKPLHFHDSSDESPPAYQMAQPSYPPLPSRNTAGGFSGGDSQYMPAAPYNSNTVRNMPRAPRLRGPMMEGRTPPGFPPGPQGFSRPSSGYFTVTDDATKEKEAKMKRLETYLKAAQAYRNPEEPDFRHIADYWDGELTIDGRKYTINSMGSIPRHLEPEKVFTPCYKGITGFFRFYSPLSNHYPVKIIIGGRKYNCTEQYYMMQKARTFKDKQTELKIMRTDSPGEQKGLGRTVRGFDEDFWAALKQEHMYTALEAKFTQNEYLKQFLLDTGDTIIVEASIDTYWGIGVSLTDPGLWDQNNWVGRNALGKLLTSLREEIKAEKMSSLFGNVGDGEYIEGYDNADCLRTKGKSSSREKAESLLPDLVTLEGQVNFLLTKKIKGMDDFTRILKAKKEFQAKCVEIMMIDPDTSNQHAIEQLLWKTAFYQVIEVIKKQMAAGDSWEPNMLRQSLMGVLDEGRTFYEKLLSDLQSEYQFNLEDYYSTLTPYPTNLKRRAKLSLYTAHICLLCLGDLARYREQIMQMTNYGKARSWYIMAKQVMPKNGRPYNQLAILAMYTKRKLEAVYYFMRSLAASNPFLNGREILMSIFEEVRKKAEVVEHKRSADKERMQKKKAHQHSADKRGSGDRVEVWIHTDGTSSEDRIKEEGEDENELDHLSANELNKRLTLSFLHVHGKLFCKVGLEKFPDVSSQLLHEFKAVLNHVPCPLEKNRLIQLVTINMYAIHNSIPQDVSGMDENCRPLLQEYAVQLGLDMYALIGERCRQLLTEHIESGDQQIFSEEVQELMPSIVIWTNWMSVHQDLWNPPPLPRDPELGPVIDIWQITADLLNLLNKHVKGQVKLYRLDAPAPGLEELILEEASQMAGFVPLALFSEDETYVDSTENKALARDCLRIERYIFFCQFLAGLQCPLLKWDVSTHTYQAAIKEFSDDQGLIEEKREQTRSESDDVIIESESEEEINTSGGTEEIHQLRAKKQELQKQVQQKARQEESIKALLEDNERLMTIEIHPLFLIPDTNCFIDHLKGIQKLLQSERYTLVVPLVVISELDGLSKGSKEGQYDSFEHADKVKRNAKATVEYLEKEFEGQNSLLRAITNQGSVMNTIAFRSEELAPGGNNDDVILTCCLHYIKDKARDYMPRDRDGPITLSREVVLLTDDRNLRLKAHTRNVPVKDLPKFLRWAKIS